MGSLGQSLFLIVAISTTLYLRTAAGKSARARLDEVEAGHKRIKELAHHYEVVGVDTRVHEGGVQRRRRSTGDNPEQSVFRHPESTSFTVPAFGKRLQLNLHLNNHLIPRHFELSVAENNGDLFTKRSAEHCYYQGSVDGVGVGPTFAAISTCNGLSGMFGLVSEHSMEQPVQQVQHGDNVYYIEPLVPTAEWNGTHLHAVYRSQDAVGHKSSDNKTQTQSFCGLRDQVQGQPPVFKAPLLLKIADQVEARVRRQTTAMRPRLYIEIALIMDNSMYNWLGNSNDYTQHYVMLVANLADLYFSILNVKLTVSAVWVDRRLQQVDYASRTSERVLKEFLEFAGQNFQSSLPPHDTLMLFTEQNLGDSQGYAYIGKMCERASSAGVVRNVRNNYGMTALILVHELGHLLNLSHNPQDKRILVMNPGIPNGVLVSPQQIIWAHMSLEELQQSYAGRLLECLKNEPGNVTVAAPRCGNGYVEGTEQCDCGSPDQCREDAKRCCDPATCRFVTGAVCSTGACCHNCQYRPTSHVCRPALTGGCDVEERCSGNSSLCPADTHVQYGRQCGTTSSPAHCFKGRCGSRDNQCRQIWDIYYYPKARAYIPNVHSVGGVCNRICQNDFTNYSCPVNLCGYLTCNVFPAKQDGPFRFFMDINGSCALYSTPDNVYIQTVNQFTSCGRDMVCSGEFGRCVSIASLNISKCPEANGAECGGNGVCTTLTTCHCNRGWTGSNCTTYSTATRSVTFHALHVATGIILATLFIVMHSLGC